MRGGARPPVRAPPPAPPPARGAPRAGIGGLDKEFSDIFRRAFASRVVPASIIAKLGTPHVKGMLLRAC